MKKNRAIIIIMKLVFLLIVIPPIIGFMILFRPLFIEKNIKMSVPEDYYPNIYRGHVEGETVYFLFPKEKRPSKNFLGSHPLAPLIIKKNSYVWMSNSGCVREIFHMKFWVNKSLFGVPIDSWKMGDHPSKIIWEGNKVIFNLYNEQRINGNFVIIFNENRDR